MTLFFQDVQGLSAIQTSLRFLPMVFSGTVTNIVTGLLVPSVSANLLISLTVGLTSLSPNRHERRVGSECCHCKFSHEWKRCRGQDVAGSTHERVPSYVLGLFRSDGHDVRGQWVGSKEDRKSWIETGLSDLSDNAKPYSPPQPKHT